MSRGASMVRVAVLAAFERALNAALRLDSETRERLADMDDKVVAVELTGLGQRIWIQPGDGGVRLMGDYSGEVDVTLRGTPLSMVRISARSAGESLFDGAVEFEGDVDLGIKLRRIIEGLNYDLEEHLSRFCGDVLAHQIGSGVRLVRGWGKRAATRIGEDIVDYLREERATLPYGWETDKLLGDIDGLRDAVDRLEARCKRLRWDITSRQQD